MAQIDPETRPSALGPPFTGHFRVILDTPRGLQALHGGTKPTITQTGSVPATQIHPAGTIPQSLTLRSSIYQTTNKSGKTITEDEAASLVAQTAAQIGGAAVLYHCDTCGVDCTHERYHSLKIRDFELCPPCYLDGRFPSTMYSGDFVKLTTQHSGINGVDAEKAYGDAGEEWGDAEVLLLLEGIELFDDDWVQVAQHVGTRSKEACLAKFVQLPIDENYNEEEGSSTSTKVNGSTHGREGDLGMLRFGRIPFEKADNPVLSVVAFLAGMTGVDAGKAITAGEELKTEGDDASLAMDVESSTGPAAASNTSLKSLTSKPAPQRLAHLALSSISTASSQLATTAQTQLQTSLSKLIKTQLTKIEMKLAKFEEIEETLEEERRAVEALRGSLLAERASLRKTVEKVGASYQSVGGIPPAQQQMMMGAVQNLNSGTGHPVQPIDVDPAQLMDVSGTGGPVVGGSYAQLA